MKYSLKLSVFLFASLALTGSALGSDTVVGKWHMKIKFERDRLTKFKSPEDKAKKFALMSRAEALVVNLTLKPDHTFVIESWDGKKQNPTRSGKWTYAEKKITLQRLEGGKPMGDPVVYYLDKDGKTYFVIQGPAKTTLTR